MDPLTLTLSIAAGIILAVLILILWPWILLFLIGGIAILGIALLISSLLPDSSEDSPPSTRPVIPERNVEAPQINSNGGDSSNLPNTLSEMLRVGPPLIYKAQKTEVWFLAATPSTNARTRLYIEIKPEAPPPKKIDSSMALDLIREPLCSPNGVLTTYSYVPTDITAVIYHGKSRVGIIDLPEKYCNKSGKQ